MAVEVHREIIKQTKSLSRRKIIEQSLAEFGALIVVESFDDACALADSLATGFEGLWQRTLADLREMRFDPRRPAPD